MRGILRHLQIGVSDKALMWEELKTIFAREGNGTSVLVVQSVAFDVVALFLRVTPPPMGSTTCTMRGTGEEDVGKAEAVACKPQPLIRCNPVYIPQSRAAKHLPRRLALVLEQRADNFVPCAAVLSNPLVTSFKFVLWYICVDLWAEFARMLVPHSPENSVVIVHSISFGPEPARKPGAKPRIIEGNPPQIGGYFCKFGPTSGQYCGIAKGGLS
ncbi:hypothetical protein B0H16DRAFT_1479722 [Mycena metata]|uniref:Uncharacterized protein n=1 Tax=Mycena metata TaxID=1033252 RepID=A0AAD7H4H6_9AGAR|nr:hypothetical protein B0H16DRAFT_1479722 [Mycena metata]